MIADLKPYPAMKDSGVEWLGDVPEHWEVRRLKHWLQMNQSALSEKTDPGYSFEYLDIGSVGTGRLVASPQRIRFEAAPSRARRVVRAGDTIVSTVRTYLKAVWYAEDPVSDLVASTGFAVLTPPTGNSPKYLSYLAQSDSFTHRVTAESVGIAYPAIAESKLATFEAAIPPLPEQAAIVRYLDHVDRRVRRLTRAKRKLIALLTEQKQAIIHRAVTRGLDPDVPLKDSGLPWCPEVPGHWELKPNRAHLRQRKVLVGERHAEYTLLSLTKRGVIVRDLTDNKGKFSADMGTSQEVRSGDLVMCLFDVPETPRTVGLSKHDGMITGAYTVFELQNKQAARWLEQFYLAMDDRKALSPLYSGLRNTIPKPRFLGTKTPIPPPLEQAAIVEYLDQATADIDATITRAEREIELLGEYRTRLIANVVTGKLDVRDAAAALPEVDPLAEDDNADELDADLDMDADELDEPPEEVEA